MTFKWLSHVPGVNLGCEPCMDRRNHCPNPSLTSIAKDIHTYSLTAHMYAGTGLSVDGRWIRWDRTRSGAAHVDRQGQSRGRRYSTRIAKLGLRPSWIWQGSHAHVDPIVCECLIQLRYSYLQSLIARRWGTICWYMDEQHVFQPSHVTRQRHVKSKKR